MWYQRLGKVVNRVDCGRLDLASDPRFCRVMCDRIDIDVTPEMIEAGIEMLRSYSDTNRELLRLVVKETLDAMLAVSPVPLCARYSFDSP